MTYFVLGYNTCNSDLRAVVEDLGAGGAGLRLGFAKSISWMRVPDHSCEIQLKGPATHLF